MLGKVQGKRGRIDEAMRLLLHAETLDPQDEDIQAAIARTLAKQGKPRDAVKRMEQSLSNNAAQPTLVDDLLALKGGNCTEKEKEKLLRRCHAACLLRNAPSLTACWNLANFLILKAKGQRFIAGAPPRLPA